MFDKKKKFYITEFHSYKKHKLCHNHFVYLKADFFFSFCGGNGSWSNAQTNRTTDTFSAPTTYSSSMELTTLSIFQADAIMSRLNIADYQKEGNQPTLLITSDIVCLANLRSPTLGGICVPWSCGGTSLSFMVLLLECYHLYDCILNCSWLWGGRPWRNY